MKRKILNKFYKLFWRSFWISIFVVIILILLSNAIIFFYSNEKIFSNLRDVPKKKVALVLGTSKYLVGKKGIENVFYKERLESVEELFKSKKIDFIILSGTNDSKYYNEPESMKKDLLKKKIPEDKIFLDYAGFRTLDSILRVKKVFSQSDIIIVSQKFHLQRAITIATLNDIKAIGYITQESSVFWVLKTHFREIFSRINFLLDFILQKEARFYGEEIEIK